MQAGNTPVDEIGFSPNPPPMWGIELSDATGRAIKRVVVDVPIEAVRAQCRETLETHPDAVIARLISTDGFLEYVYPER